MSSPKSGSMMRDSAASTSPSADVVACAASTSNSVGAGAVMLWSAGVAPGNVPTKQRHRRYGRTSAPQLQKVLATSPRLRRCEPT